MKSILFIHNHTLYSKVTIPVILSCVENGWNVTIHVNRLTLFGVSYGFSKRVIKKNPTGVKVINPKSLEFVADLIGLGDEWRAVKDRINFSIISQIFPSKFDVVVGTTKNLKRLSSIAQVHTSVFALGYQHFPVLLKVGADDKEDSCKYERNSVFLTKNSFANRHSFPDIVKGHQVVLNSFTFLDVVHRRRTDVVSKEKTILIFHPGGYRDVISSFGDSKEVCYASQMNFLKRLCMPLISMGLKPVIKIHPLRARYHDWEDLVILIDEFERGNKLEKGSIGLIGPEDWFWNLAFNSTLVLTFGSSSIYELWSAGVKNVFVCNFEGVSRSQKFDIFDSIFIDSYEDYLDLLKNPNAWNPVFDQTTEQIYNAYNDLFLGSSVDNALSFILQNMEK